MGAAAPPTTRTFTKLLQTYGTTPYLASVVDEAEARLLTEVRLDELGMSGVLRDQLINQCRVGGLREPTFLIHERHDAHRLQTHDVTMTRGQEEERFI